MIRPSRIFFIPVLMVLLAGSVLAQEMVEKTGEEEGTQPPMMTSGMQGMMCMPMMQQMMGGQGMMGMKQMPMMRGQGMMGHMPMMQRMMGGQGMMGMKQTPMMQQTMGGGGMIAYIADLAAKLDLSEEQRDKIKDILTSHKKDMIKGNADREVAEVELYEPMQQEEPDLDFIEEQTRKIANLEAEIRYSQIKVWADVKAVLTEEQRTALKKLLKDKQAHMMGGKKVKPGEPGTAGHHK